MPSMSILKDALYNETSMNSFLSFLKRIKLLNNKFAQGLILFDGSFEKLWHALIYEADLFFSSRKNGKF